MEKMKTRFIIAVTQRLSAAADTNAKVELIEELSDNLYSRWQDLVGNGANEEDAYRQALDDLGDVDELLAYLDSLGPEGELPKQEPSMRDFTSELLHGVEGIFRETVIQTKDAVDQAAEIVRNVADKIKEKYPNGFKGKIYVHVDNDEEAEKAGGAELPQEPAEQQPEGEKKDAGWSFTAGYNRDRGGFFCETGRPAASQRVTGTTLPSQNVRAVDIQLVNGDVTIRLDENPEADILLDGDVDHLEVRMNDEGVLSVRQGNTASSSFFFLRGLASADVEMTLPRRFWESIQIITAHGDIEIDGALEVSRLRVKTSSGDVSLQEAACTEVSFKSASGDLECGGNIGSVLAETASGDITLTGDFGVVQSSTASGDIEITGGVQKVRAASASGDLEIHADVLPEELEISSKSGDCEVYIPGGTGFTLQFSTVSGKLETDFALVGPVGARSGEAIYLDGGGRIFHITSISGDLSLFQQ